MDNGKIFINYRDSASKWQAYSVYYALRSVFSRDVFIDKVQLRSGDWQSALLNTIETNRHFIVVLSTGSLDFTGGQGEWFRREIRHAQKHNRNIVPILFDGFSLDDRETKEILSAYRLKILLSQQYIRVSSNNFETDIILLNQFLNGREEIVEMQLTQKSKKAISKYLRKEQESVTQLIPGKSEAARIPSKETLSDSVQHLTNNQVLKRDFDAIEIGTTPYIVSSTDSFGIRLPEVNTLQVDIVPVLDTSDQTWLGLYLQNKEGFSIDECYVELVKVEDQNGSEQRITLPRTLGWSFAHESKHGILNIGRSSSKKIDVARTSRLEDTIGFVGINGRRIGKLGPGNYVAYLRIHGIVHQVEKVPKLIGVEFSYRGGKDLIFGWKINDLKQKLNDAFNTLTPREARVLRLRFGLDDGRSRSLEEVAKKFGLPRERIRQIEGKALQQLRKPLR